MTCLKSLLQYHMRGLSVLVLKHMFINSFKRKKHTQSTTHCAPLMNLCQTNWEKVKINQFVMCAS